MTLNSIFYQSQQELAVAPPDSTLNHEVDQVSFIKVKK